MACGPFGGVRRSLRLQSSDEKELAMKRLLVLVAVLVPLSLLVAGCDSGGGARSAADKKIAREGEDRTKAAMQKPGGLKSASAPTK
jgi:hypothetical protein